MVTAGVMALSHFSLLFEIKSGLYFTYFWISVICLIFLNC